MLLALKQVIGPQMAISKQLGYSPTDRLKAHWQATVSQTGYLPTRGFLLSNMCRDFHKIVQKKRAQEILDLKN
jgi:hypothetical protein